MELNNRLVAVEQIKAYRDHEYRRNRRTLRIVFATGVLLGVTLALVVLLVPFNLPDISFFAMSDASDGNTINPVLVAFGAITAACAIVLPLSLSRRHDSRFMGF